MLVISRKVGESFYVGNDIKITIVEARSTSSNKIRIGIEAPEDMLVLREELVANVTDRLAAKKKKEEKSEQ